MAGEVACRRFESNEVGAGGQIGADLTRGVGPGLRVRRRAHGQGGGASNRPSELGDGSGQEGSVGIRRRSVVAVPSHVVGRELDRGLPGRVVEARFGPAGRDRAGVDDVEGVSGDALGHDLAPALEGEDPPCSVGPDRSRGVAVGRESGLEQERAASEPEGRPGWHPPGSRAGVAADQGGDHVGPGAQPGGQVDLVVVEAPARRADRAPAQLGAVHPEGVAAVGRDPGGGRVGHGGERQLAAHGHESRRYVVVEGREDRRSDPDRGRGRPDPPG